MFKFKNFYLFSYLLLLQTSVITLDAATPWQLFFQDPATPVMEGIINFHNDLMFFIIIIVIFVLWLLVRCIFFFTNNKNTEKFIHGTVLEFVLTITPSIILMIIAIPSFALLYSMDEIIDPVITVKVIGHQWYWSYEYNDNYNLGDLNFDSYMIATNDLEKGQLRLLEVDNRLVLPTNTHIRLIITSSDVLHCWAIPSLGIKLDACPGRLNQTTLFVKREGVFYGQCSEICGINHGFMPIVVEVTNTINYVNWLEQNQD
jgi:cytochrome c oxidase subunit 2